MASELNHTHIPMRDIKPEPEQRIERLEAEVERAETANQLNKRVRWKTDLYILPLLSSVHFLAQMVCSHITSKANSCGTDQI